MPKYMLGVDIGTGSCKAIVLSHNGISNFIRGEKMNSRERVLATLQHSEPDKIPFDLGGAPNTGIHIIAYRNLLKQWRDDRGVELGDVIFQTALIDEDNLQRLKVDLRGLDFSVFGSAKILSKLREDDKYFFFTYDWGMVVSSLLRYITFRPMCHLKTS